MTIYVVLLRGVNVGGYNKLSMAKLKELLPKLGFADVVTFIQSGNIALESEINDPSAIDRTIKQGIRDTFSLDVEVFALSLQEFTKIIDENPFREKVLREGEKIGLIFLSEKPSDKSVDKLLRIDGGGDEVATKDKAVYILVRKGYSGTVYSNNFIERTLSTSATGRNLETMKKLAKLAATHFSTK